MITLNHNHETTLFFCLLFVDGYEYTNLNLTEASFPLSNFKSLPTCHESLLATPTSVLLPYGHTLSIILNVVRVLKMC